MSAAGLLFGPDGWGALLLKGALVTVALALVTVPFGFGGGLALAGLKLSRWRAVRGLSEAYTTFFRGIPDLLALFIVYFGLQSLLDHARAALGLASRLELSAFVAGVIALSVVVAAYSGEVWVAALQTVPSPRTAAGPRWRSLIRAIGMR